MLEPSVKSVESNHSISYKIERLLCAIKDFLCAKGKLIGYLSTVALACYGFELFNLHLTIDEEVHAYASRSEEWIQQGRWGMYLLSRFLFPQPVIPFAPLFVALTSHLLAVVVLLHAWGIKDKFATMSAGTIFMGFPGMVYIYVFNSINFGIGVGFLLIALAVLVFARASGASRLLAVFPATFAIAIYQGMAVALAAAFAVQIIAETLRSGKRHIDMARVGLICAIVILAFLGYGLTQKLALVFSGLQFTYIDQFFDFGYLWQQPKAVFLQLEGIFLDIYGGTASYFGTSTVMFSLVMLLVISGLVIRVIQSETTASVKILLILLTVVIVLLPFVPGLVMRGHIPLRTMLTMPISLAGLVALGTTGHNRVFKQLAGLILAICTVQFVASTNAMFSSSALASEADRLTAVRILERIESAKAFTGAEYVKYLEVIGYLENEPTRLRPKSEVIGASFFEWDQGNVYRILYFINTLTTHGLSGLPASQRRELMSETKSMPVWPVHGSVRVIGNIAVVKFGDYSQSQLQRMADVP